MAEALPRAGPGSEADLLERAKAGDAAAWSHLYHENFHRLYRDVGFLVGVPSITEDLVQETFAAALTSLVRFDGRSNFTTWLRGIAHNIVRHHWRAHSRRTRAYDRYELVAPSGVKDRSSVMEDEHLRQQRADVLAALLETIPAAWREAFILCDVQGLPAVEAAERLGVSVGNLRVRATRARARIRSELVRLGWLEEKELDS